MKSFLRIGKSGWPALASRHGLGVGLDEVWTGARDPRWVRVALPGPPFVEMKIWSKMTSAPGTVSTKLIVME